jgi:hypothetical protein
MLRHTQLLGAMLTALAVLVAPLAVGPAAHAADHHTIVLTLVRHAQSDANAARVIDTTVPGPDITALGYGQAADAAHQLSVNRYDGIYASTMVRTQETAAPMSEALDEPVTVLPGPARNRSRAQRRPAGGVGAEVRGADGVAAR